MRFVHLLTHIGFLPGHLAIDLFEAAGLDEEQYGTAPTLISIVTWFLIGIGIGRFL